MPQPRRQRPLSRKYSVFTALLLFYVVFIFIAYDVSNASFDVAKTALLGAVAVLAATAIAKYTNRVMARPLILLQKGIASVRDGRLETIQVSRTGDEVEFLGESFNAMIEALVASRNEIQQHQELLEERIRGRTEALEEATQKALAANRAKSEFLANTSHELRTPMGGILGMLDIVLDSRLTSEQREQLLTAKGCANTLLALLNDILDLSKIEAGKMGLERISFELLKMVTECVKSMQPKAQAKGIVLRLAAASGLPRRIVGDPLRLRQILINLLANAVKFTDQGFVELRVSTQPGADAGRAQLDFEVIDTGAGIAAEKLSAIFDRFTQADGSISRKYGGSGLGLAITHKLVTMHGGNISVESKLGEGSTFRVSIPCEPVQEEPQVPVKVELARAGAADTESSREGPVRILIVEDNPVNQKVVTLMLKRHGYEVETANHGGEALEVLQRTDVGLVLMDLQMPVVDGLEATRVIRRSSRWAGLPIVAMTAHAMHGDRERCLQAGMDGYLTKPLNRTQLIATVDSCLRPKNADLETLPPVAALLPASGPHGQETPALPLTESAVRLF